MAKRPTKRTQQSQDRRMKWWREARFGMFIHWGLYALPEGIWKDKEIPGIGEWIQKRANIPVSEYEKLAEQFNPVKFNAKEWVQVVETRFRAPNTPLFYASPHDTPLLFTRPIVCEDGAVPCGKEVRRYLKLGIG